MIVFTFPGQGSQKPGMGDAWREHPSWELVVEASSVLGRDLEALLLHTDAEELKLTDNAQLSTFLTSLVVLDAVERLGVEPAAAAGHSLGEYTALVASGALAFDDGLRLVAERGAAMREAATDRTGTMAAVLGLDDDDVEVACARVDGDVWVANYNAPGQVVVAGEPEAVAEAAAVAKELGAKKVMPMAVSGAFHTPFMAPARERLRKAIDAAELREPETAGVRQRRRPPPLRPRRVGRPAGRPALQPGAVAPDPRPPRGRRRHASSWSWVRASVLTGMAKRTVSVCHHPVGVHPRRPRQAAHRAGDPQVAGPPRSSSTRASTSSPPSAWW